MGTLRSTENLTGHVVNGVRLGEPLELDGDPSTYEWDDSAYPTGTVELVDGVVVVTPDKEAS